MPSDAARCAPDRIINSVAPHRVRSEIRRSVAIARRGERVSLRQGSPLAMQPSLWRVRWLVKERACSRIRRTRMLDTQTLVLLAVVAVAFVALVVWFIYQRTQ